MANPKKRGLQSNPLDDPIIDEYIGGRPHLIRLNPQPESVRIPGMDTAGKRWRDQIDESQLDQLVGAIDEQGQLQPIGVKRTSKKGVYDLIFGARRVLASRILDERREEGFEVEAKVWAEDAEPTLIEMAEISENLHRQELSALEESDHLERYIELLRDRGRLQTVGRPSEGDEDKMTTDDVAEAFGMSGRTFYRTMSIAQMPTEVKGLLKSSPYENMRTVLDDLASIEDKESQLEVTKRLVSGRAKTAREARRFIKVAKSEPVRVDVPANKTSDSSTQSEDSAQSLMPSRVDLTSPMQKKFEPLAEPGQYTMVGAGWRTVFDQHPDATMDVIYSALASHERPLAEWQNLAHRAKKKLRGSGILAIYCEPENLSGLLNAVHGVLTWHSMLTVLIDGTPKPLCCWRVGSAATKPRRLLEIDGTAKSAWQVSDREALQVLASLSREGAVVVDPFAEDATVVKAAAELGMGGVGAQA